MPTSCAAHMRRSYACTAVSYVSMILSLPSLPTTRSGMFVQYLCFCLIHDYVFAGTAPSNACAPTTPYMDSRRKL
jgi:hypothetical protein